MAQTYLIGVKKNNKINKNRDLKIINVIIYANIDEIIRNNLPPFFIRGVTTFW